MDISFFKNKGVIYCRKSNESEDRQILSLQSQYEEATKLAKSFGIHDVSVFQESKSAKASGTRPNFKQLMVGIKKGKFDVIICWKLDRLARNLDEGGQIIDLLHKEVIKAIITPFKVYYPSESALTMALEFASATQYSRDLSQNVKRGLIKKAEQGYPPYRAVIGFLNQRTGEKGYQKWFVDNSRFPIIKQMFEMYLSGNFSGGQIGAWAENVAKLRTVKHKRIGDKPLSQSAVYRLLSEPIYAGFFYIQGKRYELAPELPRAITEAQHQRILQLLNRVSVGKAKTHEVIYRGYIKSPVGEFVGPDIKYQIICDCKFKFSYKNRVACPKCNRSLMMLEKPKYLHYVYYRNISRKKRGLPTKYLSETKVTKFLLSEVCDILQLSNNLILFFKTRFKELNDEKLNKEASILNNRNKRLSRLEDKKYKYREMYVDNLISRDEYVSDIAIIDNEIKIINSTSISQVDWFETAHELVSILDTFQEVFNIGDVQAKRSLLSKLGANLIWDEKNLYLESNSAIKQLIEGIKEAKTKNPQFEPKTTLADKDETGVFDSVSSIMCTLCNKVRNIIITQELKNGDSEKFSPDRCAKKN